MDPIKMIASVEMIGPDKTLSAASSGVGTEIPPARSAEIPTSPNVGNKECREDNWDLVWP